MLHLDAEPSERLSREIREIVCHNGLCTAAYGGGHDMPIVIVRQLDRRLKPLEIRNTRACERCRR